LVDVWAVPTRVRARNAQFSGRTLKEGGGAQGNGFRVPLLAMFQVLNDTGNGTHVLPILACHLGSSTGDGTNILALEQIRQYKDIHVAQKFANPQPNPPDVEMPFACYIDLDGAATRIQELVVTGDFNVDFLDQSATDGRNTTARKNRDSYDMLTPTLPNGGPADPLATALPGAAPQPAMTAPFTGQIQTIGNRANKIQKIPLKTANTTQGTIYKKYSSKKNPTTYTELRGGCLDNFFFGGTNLAVNYGTLTQAANPVATVNNPVADACLVIDIAAQIVQSGQGGAGKLDVSGIYEAYVSEMQLKVLKGVDDDEPPEGRFHFVEDAPKLASGAPAAPLSMNDRLIAANFLSDHLPTVVEFQVS
jgi:hypothetical protein